MLAVIFKIDSVVDASKYNANVQSVKTLFKKILKEYQK